MDALPNSSANPAPFPENEVDRLAALRRYSILDTPPEAAFDRITALAARLFNVPITLVSLVDESRGWFKSAYGFDLQEVERDATICSLALLSDEVLVIPDTRQDERLACNPFVQSESGLRFYAGAPLLTQDGFNLGTLCLIDTQPRPALSDEQVSILADLAAMVMDELELRLAARKIAQLDAALLEVTQGVSTATGEAFLAALAQHFTKALGVDYAYIGLIDGDNLEAITTAAACAKGEIIENFGYLLQDTPCREVLLQRKLCCYPSGVQALFPHAPLLAPLGVDSYAAIPFFDSAGTPIGLLSVMNGKPLEHVQLTESLLTIFALRVATELERQQTEAARQQAQQTLETLIEQRTSELSQANQQLQLEVTERQQAEAALYQEQELLKVLLDNVQAGIVACDAEGRLTLFNRVAREFHGLPPQPLPPERWAAHYDLYRPDGKTPLPLDEIPLFQALQGQSVKNVEMVIAPKQGAPRTLLASGQVIVDAQGQQQGAVAVMHDITERKQAEAERARLNRQQVEEQVARLEAETDQRRSAFLADISTALASSLKYEQTLANVADLAVPFFADWCAIDLLQDNRIIQRVAVAHHNPEKVQLAWDLHQRYPKRLEEAEGIAKVLRTGQPEVMPIVSDAALASVAQDAEHLRILRELGLKSAIVSPLIARGQILGAITFVTAESERRYSETDCILAEDVAHRAAIAIDNARLYQEAQKAQQAAERSAERITRLQSVTAALSESLTPAEVSEVIADQGMAALGAEFAMVALLDERARELEVVRSVGVDSRQLEGWQRFPLSTAVPLAEAVRTGQPIWAEPPEVRAARYPHLAAYYEQHPLKTWISVPLMTEGRAVGGISFGFMKPPYLVEEQQAFILSLAQQYAQAIVRTHLYEAEREARTQAESANRVKDEFLAVLSHELRSPLNPIMGWAKLLRTRKLDAAKTDHALATIERNAKLQTELIEDLLDVSRILQGKLSLTMSPVNLAETIQSALETIRSTAAIKSIEVRSEGIGDRSTDLADSSLLSPPSSPLFVLGDSARLHQVLWNLLTNAVKFTPAGGRVEVVLSLVTSQGAQVEEAAANDLSLKRQDTFAQITVSDTGKGIASEFLPHVFDYFRQADSTTTRQFGGLGLGLAIVRHLVELHGGTVQAESPGEGQGATFTVRLPALKDERIGVKNDPVSPLPTAPGLQPLPGVHVLLVDDEADARDLMAFVLEEAGATATIAASAAAALTLLPQVQPDIVISDIGMPEMDGYMLIRAIRQLPPEQGGQVPAIALTAYAGEIDRQQAIAAGFQRHLAKPVVPNDLVEAIKALVEETALQRAVT
ncbi:GAF domain-containing protein [Pseudanabaena sp. FACHB-2040]|nr:GAF domain-containing protein [Pseudanabaena sp. FACHB-2040]